MKPRTYLDAPRQLARHGRQPGLAWVSQKESPPTKNGLHGAGIASAPPPMFTSPPIDGSSAPIRAGPKRPKIHSSLNGCRIPAL